MLTDAGADELAQLAGVDRDLAAGMILVIALDCTGHAIEGATIDAPGAESVLYLGADTRFDPSLGATSTDSAALLVNVPAGPVEISIAIGDQVATTTIDSHANALTTTYGR
jgi:hypothetical protein